MIIKVKINDGLVSYINNINPSDVINRALISQRNKANSNYYYVKKWRERHREEYNRYMRNYYHRNKNKK